MKKLRLNYVVDGDTLVGVPVNIKGVVVQAETLEELNEEAVKISRMMLSTLTEALEVGEFELHRVDVMESTINVQMQERLRRYEEMFGII